MELSTMQARLTITIPEDLRRRAKAQAAAQGTTLSQDIRKRLEEFAPDWEALEDAEDLRVWPRRSKPGSPRARKSCGLGPKSMPSSTPFRTQCEGQRTAANRFGRNPV